MDDIVNIAQGSDNGVSSTETAAYEEQTSTDETSEEEEEEINVTDCDDEDIANMDNNDENIATNDVGHSSKKKESSKIKSEMSAFLPPMQHWGWYGKEYRRMKGKHFYKSIQREREEREIIRVGDCVVFLTTGKPYIGQIDLLWESSGKMIVNVRWYYHPEECGYSPSNFEYPGALFDSTHTDENDVQTISHRCNILTLKDFKEYIEQDPQNYQTFYENNDLFYMAGFYDTRTKSITIDPAIRLKKSE